MKNFFIGWIIYQLLFIGVLFPIIWNSSIGTKCKVEHEKMLPNTMLVFMTVPLLWFVTDSPSCTK